MASPRPSSPFEQAKILRRLADDVEQEQWTLPPDVFAPILDLMEHRDRRVQLDALERACGAWRDEDHPELSEGSAVHVAACRLADDEAREGRSR